MPVDGWTKDFTRRAKNARDGIAARWIASHLGCHLGTQYGPEDAYYCMCSNGRHRIPGSEKLPTLTAWPLDLSLSKGEEE